MKIVKPKPTKEQARKLLFNKITKGYENTILKLHPLYKHIISEHCIEYDDNIEGVKFDNKIYPIGFNFSKTYTGNIWIKPSRNVIQEYKNYE